MYMLYKDGEDMEYKKIENIILSYKADPELVDYILSLGINVIKTVPVGYDKNIDDHPDIALHPINERKFISAPSAFHYYKDKLGSLGLEVICGNKELGGKYPGDCYYNIGRVGKYYFGKSFYVDSVLEKELINTGHDMIEVRQAYAKCSSLAIGKNSAITSDKGIYKELSAKGIDVGLFRQEGIELDGYPVGFLGGTCGMIGSDRILFTGNIDEYSDGLRLRNFLNEHKIKIYFPKNLRLRDLGSLIPIGGFYE